MDLYQGSALSPYLFVLVIDVLIRNIRDNILWCILFANDIVLIDGTRVGINYKLKLWKEALEYKGFKFSKTKAEYMMFSISAEGKELKS